MTLIFQSTMRVAQFVPYFPPHKWGVETVAEEFSKYFISEKCWEVLNVTFSVGQKSLQSYQQDGYKVLIIPAFDIISNYPFPKFWTKQFRSVLKQVKNRDPDIIQTHTRFFLSTFIGGICAKLRKKKRVHIEHGSGLVKGLIWRKSLFANIYDYTFGKLCFSGADQIVAISQGNIPFIKKFSKTPIEVIYRGLDFPEIKRKKQNSDSISLGFIGRLVNLKGVDVLISAFADLIDDYPDIHLQIIGDGVERQNLEKQVQSLNIQDKVSLLGYQDKNTLQNQILPSLDIFVNPSLQEGLPTTVIEALLAKCIVVATDVWGTKEISDNSDFILVQPASRDSLLSGIRKALAQLGSHWLSADMVREKFSRKKRILQYANIYKLLCK